MKSFKHHMAEVAEPKSAEEKKFKDMHIPEVKPHPVAEPTQHKAEKPKAKRKADQEGDANYDQAYNESVEQIDEISKDMADRYMKKAMPQYKRAQTKQHVGGYGSTTQKGADANKERLKKRHKGIGSVHKRQGGSEVVDRNPARNSMTGKKAPYQHESVEQIDEISKKLAGRYIKKAQMDTAHAGDQIATGSMGQMGASPDVKKGYEKQRQKGIAKLIRRRVGTADAVRKLTGTARVAAKEEVSEVTQSAIKKPMNITGPDGKVRTVMKKAKNVEVDDHGQEKMRENKKADLMKKLAKTSATTKKGKEAVTLKKAPWEKKEDLDEAVKVGNMKLKDGSSMKVTKEDAKLLNQMFKGLNSQNRKQMEKVMMTDKSGFNEIVGFAREAM